MSAATGTQVEQIPETLRWQIMEVQVRKRCSWREACEVVAERVDEKLYQKQLKKQLERAMNGEVLRRVNKMRESIRKQYEVLFGCNVCDCPMLLSPNSVVHERVKAFLRQKGWGHQSCHDKQKAQSAPKIGDIFAE